MISLCKHDIAYLSFEDLKYFNFRLVFQIFLLTYLSTDFVDKHYYYNYIFLVSTTLRRKVLVL